MGSSGSGHISDYPGSSPKTGSGGGGGGGSSPGEDRCARAFSVQLEDIEQSDYFKAHNSTPPIDTELVVVQKKRLVAQTRRGEVVGNLPTNHNYLASCLKDGWSYVGKVSAAKNGPPVASVTADFAPSAP